MKKIFLLVFIILNLATGAGATPLVDLSENDKNKHAGISYNLTAAGNHSLRQSGYSPVAASFLSGGLVLALGIAKEVFHDSNADHKDVQADLMGTALGMLIPLRIEF